jgi:arginine exporter protein ArgO
MDKQKLISFILLASGACVIGFPVFIYELPFIYLLLQWVGIIFIVFGVIYEVNRK